MEKIKRIFRPYYIKVFYYKNLFIDKKINLISNFYKDYKLYKSYSLAFNKKDLKQKEADLILQYHSLEKGLLFQNMKKGFAKYRIENLHKILRDPEIIQNAHLSQIQVGYQLMCEYYEKQHQADFDINEFYSKEQYEFYKSVLDKNNCSRDFSGVIEWTLDDFFEHNQNNFELFAHSRKSTRNFTGEKFPIELIQKVIALANTAPSVCNRQANTVYLLEDKNKIDEVLKIQGGFTGYTENVNQLLILTNDRKYYYTVGERNQLYIDGGAYLLNLLYALHYYKIGNCPANWGKEHKDEKLLNQIIQIPESEKIICMIPIGKLGENFRTTASVRRETFENFVKLN